MRCCYIGCEGAFLHRSLQQYIVTASRTVKHFIVKLIVAKQCCCIPRSTAAAVQLAPRDREKVFSMIFFYWAETAHCTYAWGRINFAVVPGSLRIVSYPQGNNTSTFA